MTRAEIIQRFRDENPEVTDRVLTDVQLRTYCIQANLEICTRARLIVGNSTFAATADESQYDLSAEIDKFYDIDEYPGGGVVYYNTTTSYKRLIKSSPAELDVHMSQWRLMDSGVPQYYYRRGKYLNLIRPPEETNNIEVYHVNIPDSFNDDNITPYNQLDYLEPYHYGIVKYLQWKAKAKLNKPDETKVALGEYNDYITYMKQEIGGGKYSKIYFRPARKYASTS